MKQPPRVGPVQPSADAGESGGRRRRLLPWLGAWAILVLLGLSWLTHYSLTPGLLGGAPAIWPDGSSLPGPAGRSRLLVFAHPSCACTRATLAAVRRLTSELADRVDTSVLFVVPQIARPSSDSVASPSSDSVASPSSDSVARPSPDSVASPSPDSMASPSPDSVASPSPGFGATAIRALAHSIPAVKVADDVGGAWARQFGAATSGTALLYDPQGRLRFAGGLTPGRGHEGDSPGLSAVRAILEGTDHQAPSAPVFGCALAVSDP